MPRSDSGRAEARGWSEGLTEHHHLAGLCQLHETLRCGFPNPMSHHPGSGVGLSSSASARPSSAEEGNNSISTTQDSRHCR